MQLLYPWGMAAILNVCSVRLPPQAAYSSPDQKYHRVILRLPPEGRETSEVQRSHASRSTEYGEAVRRDVLLSRQSSVVCLLCSEGGLQSLPSADHT